MPPRDDRVHPLKHVLAGGMAGGLEIAALYPTEFVKTQLQLYPKGTFKGILDCGASIVRDKGPLGLYRGLTSLLVGTVPKTSVRFGVFGQLSTMLTDEDGHLSPFRTWLAGAGTGFVEATCVVTPVETMKTKLIHDQNRANPRYRGLVHAVTTIVKEEGFHGIYKGVAPTIGKQMGNQGSRFLVYSQVKQLLARDGEEIGDLKRMLAGATAGFVSVFLTAPFDVIKTRMQGIDAHKYKNTADCVVQLLKQDGVTGLWKGTVPRLPRVVLGQSITLAGYDRILSLLNMVI